MFFLNLQPLLHICVILLSQSLNVGDVYALDLLLCYFELTETKFSVYSSFPLDVSKH